MEVSKYLRLHLIIFLWGFTAIIGKLITTQAHVLVFYRMFFASIFLYIYIRFIRKESLKVSKNVLLKLLGIGCLMAAHWLCFFYSVKISNVSIALSTLSLGTIFAAFVEPIVYKRKFDWSEVLIGIVIVVCMSLIFQTEFKYKWGIILGIICAFIGTLFSVFNGKMSGKVSSGSIIFYEMFGGSILVCLYFVFTGQIQDIMNVSQRDFALLLLLSSLFTAYPMFESVSLMKYISPFTLILTINLEPIYGIFFAYFIFGESEQMSAVFYFASAAMILLIAINGIIKARSKKRKETSSIQTETDV